MSPEAPEIKLADLKEAREAYWDLAARFGLGPLDVHAIALGATMDAILLHAQNQYAGNFAAMERDFEKVRELFVRRGQEKELLSFALVGWYILVSTATVDPERSRLPERCLGCGGRGRVGEGHTDQVCPVCRGEKWVAA